MSLEEKARRKPLEFLKSGVLDLEWIEKIRKLVNLPSKEHYMKRKALVDDSIKEIEACKEFHKLKERINYELSRYGENLRAKKENLIPLDLWARKENRAEIITRVKAFLWRVIK